MCNLTGKCRHPGCACRGDGAVSVQILLVLDIVLDVVLDVVLVGVACIRH